VLGVGRAGAGRDDGLPVLLLLALQVQRHDRRAREGHLPDDAGNGFRVNGNTKDIVLDQCEIMGNARARGAGDAGRPDGWLLDRCVIKGNRGLAFGSGDSVGAFETPGCVVEGNGSDKLPPTKRFAAAPPVIAPRIPEEAKVGEVVKFGVGWPGGCGEGQADAVGLRGRRAGGGDGVTHTYDRPGEYKVTVVAWDEAGRGRGGRGL